ncbi:hypothetical protein RIF23_10300 [Lipingzhangella sp. LS1_29]|uniref:SCP domain-containing protein n=1 Tax=Lipingzhangella rawalii TaxID=2055835 RepID=A0ABU2H5V5_9ACTN|nr:hypothetical protein [Lipingzhangella rawalii]MDS1270689.1 hypothetical protein [Lipingzhangella rawalii]
MRSRAGAVRAAVTSRWWALPLTTGSLALMLGAVLGFQLRGSPTASVEYQVLSEEARTLQHQVDNQADTISDLRDERDDLRAAVDDLDDREDALDSREEELDEREDEVAAREDAVTEAENQAAENTFSGSGTYTVGEDIEPGTYRSEGSDCYWARLSSTTGHYDSIIANSFSSGPQVVTIEPGDAAFETSGCGEWSKDG